MPSDWRRGTAKNCATAAPGENGCPGTDAAGAMTTPVRLAGSQRKRCGTSGRRRCSAATRNDANLMQFAQQSESELRLRAMLKLGQSQQAFVAGPDDFDRDSWLLNAKNGTVDLRSGELLPHEPGRMMTKLAVAPYDPSAACPTWESFIGRVLTGVHR